jgi:predicted nucleic acid-binding protein
MSLISKIDFASLENQMRPFFRNPVILDTGPLVFLLIGLCDPSKKKSKDIWQGHTPEELELLLKLIKPFKSIIVTPQVLAECTNLLNQNTTSSKYLFLLTQIINPLKEFGEVHIKKNIILDSMEFSRFGSTDVSIIECSKKMNSLIITEDSNLKIFCHPNRIPCINFNELRPSTWN